MLAEIKKFLKLRSAEKRIFLEAYVTLGLMRAAILTMPFSRLSRSLRQLPGIGEMAPLSPADTGLACAVRLGIKRAANHTPWESACLAQSFTAQRMLQKRGIPGVFFLGINKNEAGHTESTGMEAHAWSRCGDMIITGGEGAEAFTVISIFAWDK